MITRTTTVTEDRWDEAVRLLMGLGSTTLSAHDRRVLLAMLRGPFARGMCAGEAALALYGMGWRTRHMLPQPQPKRRRRP